jgi:hypothetical protein
MEQLREERFVSKLGKRNELNDEQNEEKTP